MEPTIPFSSSQKPVDDLLKDRLKSLRLIDDIFFAACLRDNPRAAEAIIRVALDMPECVVTEMTVQDSLGFNESKGVRFDLKCKGKDGKVFDVEVQKENEKALPRRGRYYFGALTVSSLPSGNKYAELPDSYVLFICEKDPFGQGKACYTFALRDEKAHLFGDGATIRFFNCSYKGKDPYGSLASDMLSRETDAISDPVLRDTFVRGKIGERSIEVMSDLAKEIKNMGVQEGRESSLRDIVVHIMATTDYSPEEIASLLGVPLEKIESIRRETQTGQAS